MQTDQPHGGLRVEIGAHDDDECLGLVIWCLLVRQRGDFDTVNVHSARHNGLALRQFNLEVPI